MAINSIETFQNIGLTTSADKVADNKQELGQAEFLKLMTTQMTHQDPNKPMENGDFLAQLAQFSSTEGIGELNTSFKEFANSISSGQALQASTLVGKKVLVPSDQGIMSLTDDLSGEAVLNGSTDNLKISFLDSNGEAVKTLQMGAQQQGNVAFKWDGKLEDGTYTDPGLYKVKAEATVGGSNTELQTYIGASVESVALGSANAGIKLALVGLGNVDFNHVKKVY